MSGGASASADRAVVNGASGESPPQAASIPSAFDRDAIIMEVAGWVEELDLLEIHGLLAKRKRDREDAALRIETSERVRKRAAETIRARMKNRVGDPGEFLADVKAGRFNKNYTGYTIREAIALADIGLLRVCVRTQIAGPWNNQVGSHPEYTFELTEDGEKFLAEVTSAEPVLAQADPAMLLR